MKDPRNGVSDHPPHVAFALRIGIARRCSKVPVCGRSDGLRIAVQRANAASKKIHGPVIVGIEKCDEWQVAHPRKTNAARGSGGGVAAANDFPSKGYAS